MMFEICHLFGWVPDSWEFHHGCLPSDEAAMTRHLAKIGSATPSFFLQVSQPDAAVLSSIHQP
jgi:hypothetical protein